MNRVPLTKPDHPNEPGALFQTLREVFSIHRFDEGSYAIEFERRVAEICGSLFAIATNSDASALDAIFASTGLTGAAHVICPSYAPLSAINAILAAGAKPIFADIDPKNYNLDLCDVERRITPKTKAIFLVHQYGIPADGEAFAALGRDRNLILIEDATHGLGSRYNGKAIGSFGQAGYLSFHPRKVLARAEGGMVLTDDSLIASRIRSFGNMGSPTQTLNHNPPATSRMSEFQATLGHWSLDRIEEAIARRTELAHRYDDAFRTLPGVTIVYEPGRGEWNRKSYPIRVDGSSRDLRVNALRQDGIETRPGLLPVHMHPYIDARMHPPRLPHTEAAYHETLLLPMHASLTDDEQERVIRALVKALK